MEKGLKYVAYAALFAIPVIPFYVANELFFPFITGKGFLFRILVEIAFVAWVALAIINRTYRPRFSWLLAIYGAFVTWVFIADVFAVNAHKALWSNFERMDGFVTLIHVFLFFLVAGVMLAKGTLWKRWWWVFIGVSAAICFHGLMQLLCIGEVCGASGSAFAIHQSGIRLDASFGNSIYLAVYLLFASFITAWYAIESKGWLRYSLIALIVAQVFVLINTATRGAVVALVVTVGLVAVLYLLRAGKRTRRVAGVSLVALLLAVAGFWTVRESAWIAENPVLSRIASISLSELNVRFTLWSMAGEGIKDRPILGYGQEGYNYVFNQYYRPELVTQEPWFDRAHSAYFDWLVAGGIPALLLFVGLLLAALLMLFRAQNLSITERMMLAGALIAYALQAIVVFDNLFSYIPLAAVLAYLHSRTARPIVSMEKLPELSRGMSEAIVIPVAGAVLLFLILTVNVPHMRAANHLVYAISPLQGGPAENLAHFREALKGNPFARQEIAEQLVSYTARIVNDPKAPEALKNDFAVLTRDTIEKELERAPLDTRIYMQASIFYRVVGDNEKALAYIERAEELSPNRQLIMLERATVLTEVGRSEEAIALYNQVYDLSPHSGGFLYRIAAGLIMAGDTARGEQILTEVFGTTLLDDESLVMAYATTKQYDKLIAVLKLQVENNPNSPDARFRLATAYALAGRIPDARKEIQIAMARFPQIAAQGKAFLESL